MTVEVLDDLVINLAEKKSKPKSKSNRPPKPKDFNHKLLPIRSYNESMMGGLFINFIV